ncbi:hypothetical protein PMM47T1_19813 [Pseudomonas sp. M47T1]|nr:hypothetical protein PMM47T1_19813 [Pseudomonas sp. M47T1]
MVEQCPVIRFSEIEAAVPTAPGLYEIVTDQGELLKVGISVNLRKRLIQHRQSKQSDHYRVMLGSDEGGINAALVDRDAFHTPQPAHVSCSRGARCCLMSAISKCAHLSKILLASSTML